MMSSDPAAAPLVVPCTLPAVKGVAHSGSLGLQVPALASLNPLLCLPIPLTQLGPSFPGWLTGGYSWDIEVQLGCAGWCVYSCIHARLLEECDGIVSEKGRGQASSVRLGAHFFYAAMFKCRTFEKWIFDLPGCQRDAFLKVMGIEHVKYNSSFT